MEADLDTKSVRSTNSRLWLCLWLAAAVALTIALPWSIAFAAPAPAAFQAPQIVGFKIWKITRVEEAKAALQRLQIDASMDALSVPDKVRLSGPSRSERRIEQARLNVEIALELTVNDYFVLYLKPFKSKDAFLEAARKLSSDEMGELMLAYQKQLAGDAGEPLPSTASAAPLRTAKPLSEGR